MIDFNGWLILWVVAVGCVVHAYVVYPCLIAVLGWLRRRPARQEEGPLPSVSILVAAQNEEQSIGPRLRELLRQLEVTGIDGEVILASDGSTDRTVDVARSLHEPRLRVFAFPDRAGKAEAISRAAKRARHEVLVFADTRQSWDDQALRSLLSNFRDPAIGAVSGELILEDSNGVLAGIGLYWKIEKWMRRHESQFHSCVGVTGAISAVRSELFAGIPAGTILDDVYWPLRVALQGHRVVFDGRALAYDRLPDKTGDEFRRKLRTLCGNLQLLQRLPEILLPWRNPVWFQFCSHKLLRLVVPWALLAMLVANLWLRGPFFTGLLWAQVAAYALALVGVTTPLGSKSRLAATAGSFLVLNTAAFCAFWVWVTGRANRSWHKVAYQQAPVSYSQAG